MSSLAPPEESHSTKYSESKRNRSTNSRQKNNMEFLSTPDNGSAEQNSSLFPQLQTPNSTNKNLVSSETKSTFKSHRGSAHPGEGEGLDFDRIKRKRGSAAGLTVPGMEGLN